MIAKASAVVLSVFLVALTPVSAADVSTGRQQDLDAFKTQFLDIDKSYSPAARKAAETAFAALSAEAGTISDAQFELSLAHIAALADNGHTMLLDPAWTARYNRLPIEFLITPEGLYVGGADTKNRDLIGKRVTSIGGLSWPALQEVWRYYKGGRRGWRNQFIYYFIESPEILYAAGLTKSPDKLEIVYETRRGRSKSRMLAGRTDLPPLEGVEALLPPPRVLQLTREGFGGKAPLYLQELDKPFRYIEMPDRNAVYIQFRANIDFTGKIDISAYAKDVLAKLQASRPRFVILDERFNFGGDLTTTRELMVSLADIVGPKGRVFVLESGRTFSAGLASAAYVKQAAGSRATLIGTGPGDNLEFWAEGDLTTLPNSGAAFLYTLERHNYMTGCPEKDCHKPMQEHPIRIKNLQPDIRVGLSYSDFAEGNDPLLDVAFSLIAANDQIGDRP